MFLPTHYLADFYSFAAVAQENFNLNGTETAYALTLAAVVVATSYLYSTETEYLRTGALIILLIAITAGCLINYNVYLGATVLIVEVGAITALSLLQQAYYSSKILNLAPVWTLVAYPLYTLNNSYSTHDQSVNYTFVTGAEAASEVYKSILLLSDPYAPTMLTCLTWSSIFVAVLLTTIANWTELKSIKRIYRDLRSDRLLIFKKVSSEARIKLLKVNVIFC